MSFIGKQSFEIPPTILRPHAGYLRDAGLRLLRGEGGDERFCVK
jgi:hypothetical protein